VATFNVGGHRKRLFTAHGRDKRPGDTLASLKCASIWNPVVFAEKEGSSGGSARWVEKSGHADSNWSCVE
jgi:hypothetical protein